MGLGLTLVGVAWAWAVVGAQGTDMGTRALAGPMRAAGMGMGIGTCFSTLFDIALGDIDPEEGGSASGALSAVQQLASAIGSAGITSAWFASIADALAAMRTCLVIVAAVAVVCGGLAFLLPKHARPTGGTDRCLVGAVWCGRETPCESVSCRLCELRPRVALGVRDEAVSGDKIGRAMARARLKGVLCHLRIDTAGA